MNETTNNNVASAPIAGAQREQIKPAQPSGLSRAELRQIVIEMIG